jgi:sigma-E factor negative regulatory protein RseC
MIEETGRVIQVRDGYAWIETVPVTGCGSCAERRGCGTSVLASVLGRRKAPLRVVNRIGAVAGDQVVIGISESGMLRGSLAVYAAPLAGLLGGAVAGHYVLGAPDGGYPELGSILGAAAGFWIALVWLRRFSRNSAADARYQPVVLRHVVATVD